MSKACNRLRVALSLFAVLCGSVALHLAGPGKIYWTSEPSLKGSVGGVYRANLDGTEQELVVYRGLEGSVRPIKLNLDEHEMYWGDIFASRIYRSSLDGCGISILASVQDATATILGMAVDLGAGHLYWSESFPSYRIWRVNLDGTGRTPILTVEGGAQRLALDTANGKIYWTEQFPGAISRADFDGSDVETVFADDAGLRDIAIDVHAAKMYWTDPFRVRRADLDGSNVEVLQEPADPGNGPSALDLDLVNGKVYYSVYQMVPQGGSLIYRTNLDGSGVEQVLPLIPGTEGLALDTLGLGQDEGCTPAVPAISGPGMTVLAMALLGLASWLLLRYRSRQHGRG